MPFNSTSSSSSTGRDRPPQRDDRPRTPDGKGRGPREEKGQQKETAPRRELPETFDLYARYPTETEDDVRRIVGNHNQAYKELKSISTCVSLLSTTMVEPTKEFAKNGDRKFGGGYPSLLHEKKGSSLYTKEVVLPALAQMNALGLYPPKVDIDKMPTFSFYIQLRFVLTRPFYSRDDEIFYLHENAVMKEKYFRVPMVRATSWKGTFRDSATYLAEKWPELVNKLFGCARNDEDDGEVLGQRGRLIFYPTFFDAIDLDMINPHSRKTKAGTIPITMEVVPSGATGYLTIGYVPFNLLGVEESVARRQVAGDIVLSVQMIDRTMSRYGFSAKRNRGFGLADQNMPDRDTPEGKNQPGGQLQMKGEPMITFRSFAELNKAAAQLVGKLTKV